MANFTEIMKEAFDTAPELAELWKKSSLKRLLGVMLAKVRNSKNLSQKDIVALTGWDKAYVSRLEGVQGGIPDVPTLARYAEACDTQMGLIVLDNSALRDNIIHVVSAVPISSNPEHLESKRLIFERLVGLNINAQETK